MVSAADRSIPRARVVTNDADLDAAFAVRRAVFVDEQHVREDEEFDAHDAAATHFVVVVHGVVVGTARLRRVPASEGDARGVRGKIERVAVLAAHRKSGAGRALLLVAHEVARQWGMSEVFLAAQVDAIPFYERVGYEVYGDEFVQERIRHRWMRRRVDVDAPNGPGL
jgi:predicted GNAT family N-acyltransferase